MPKLNHIKSYLEQWVERGDRCLEEFKTKLADNPVHAFTWVDTVMSLTARRQVAIRILHGIKGWEEGRAAGTLGEKQPKTDEAIVETIREIAVRETLNKARWSSQSTSNGHNIMERQELAAYAELAGDFDSIYG